MTKRVAEFIGYSDDVSLLALKVCEKIPDGNTFSVRCKSHSIEKRLGAEIKRQRPELNVDLEHPDSTILCFELMGASEKSVGASERSIESSERSKQKYLVGLEISRVDQRRGFNKRKPKYRPYFHPTSMHPKIARLLVNLARVKQGSVLLDPLCGTGGILIEAGLMGLKIMGRDIDERMVDGCIRNLDFYGLKGDIRVGDALKPDGKSQGMNGEFPGKFPKADTEFPKADAIVTDLPYARSSFVTEKNLMEFYNKFISSAGKMIGPGKYLVLVVPSEYYPEMGEFDVREIYNLRIHKSLTRRIFVLIKSVN